MKHSNDSAHKVAEFLLEIKAIKLQPEKPFTWSSGWKSPIYCDNRVILSFPPIRTFICEQFVAQITAQYGKPDVIAGVATGAIAIGALVANAMNLPFIYVRPEPKAHGLGNCIEGVIHEGQSVVVIEDLISTGGSSLKAVESLKQVKADIKGLVAIFTYGFETAGANFAKANCNFSTLSNYETLIEAALKANYVTEKDLESLKEWRKNPSTWNK